MKKKLVPLLLAIMFCVTGVMAGAEDAHAEDTARVEEDVALSVLMADGDALIGHAQDQTRGVYYSDGVSVINDAGGGKIGCGGITEANMKCHVGITVIVERKVGSSWVRVTSWSADKASAYSVSISKYLAVGSGYYYRVRSTHYAESDVSNTYTGGLWM